MKPRFKYLILFLFLLVFFITPFSKSYTFKNPSEQAKLALVSSKDREEKSDNDENSEDSNVFEFIKGKDNVRDFFYDGSALLYGGIVLIGISILGIFKTLKPKKQKRNFARKRKINNPENDIRR